MAIVRIVTDLDCPDPEKTATFYARLFGLNRVMDQGWIITLAQNARQDIQLSLASEGGSGAPVPAISVEVDDLEETFARATEMGADIAYPLTDEPWGVRRFFARDPDGKLINILSHASAEN